LNKDNAHCALINDKTNQIKENRELDVALFLSNNRYCAKISPAVHLKVFFLFFLNCWVIGYGILFIYYIRALFKKRIVFVSPVLVLRADVFSSTADDEPACASYGGHVYPESVAGLPGKLLLFCTIYYTDYFVVINSYLLLPRRISTIIRTLY